MVPLSAVATFRYGSGPVQVTRYNNYPAAELQGQTPPGVASGDSLRAMEQLAAQTLPPGFAYRMDRPRLSAAGGGQHGAADLRRRGALRLHGARRAI